MALILCAAATSSAWALDGSVPAIHGDVSRSLLGDGTGVIVGIIDSGVDDLHPALMGLDSLANPRLVAESNFANDGGASADDVAGHGTRVASAALGRDSSFSGMATDARYVNARVLNNTNGFPGDTPIRNGIIYAINQGADVLNLSLNFNSSSTAVSAQLDMLVDWAAFSQGISCAVCVGNIQQASPATSVVRGPGTAFNGVTVGRTTADFSRVHTDSANAFTTDGRMKPDVVAPGTALTLANQNWETQADWVANQNGCSFATPHVAGLMAQQLEAGATHGLSTDPLVVKATMMNSAAKVLDKQGNAWEPAASANVGGVFSTARPLDSHSGAGQVDGLTLSTQYLSGEIAPGLVDSIGWDLHTIGSGQFADYAIDPNLIFGSSLTATLTWYRHVTRFDNGNGILDIGDSFSAQPLSNLDLQIFRNGSLVAQSNSVVDNVEHLQIGVEKSAQYTLRVFGANVFGGSDQFALAWFGTAVPEPGCLGLMAVGAAGFAGLGRSRGRRA